MAITDFDDPALTAAYTMDNISGSTLVDETANNNDATLTGTGTATGKDNSAITILGPATSYVDIPFVPFGASGTTEAALSFWVKATTVVATSKIFSHRIASNDFIQLEFDTTNTLDLQVRDSTTTLVQTSSGTLDLTTDFLHIVYNHDWGNNRLEVFVNGVSQIVDTTVYTGTVSSSRFTLGAYSSPGYSGFMDGALDQLRIFNRILTSSEITELYTEFAGPALPPTPIDRTILISRIWPFQPRGGFIEALEWRTDVMRAKAAEQRIALRTAPRRTFNYNFLMTDSQVASAASLINAADIFNIPDWGQRAIVTDAAVASITADVSEINLFLGSTAILWESDQRYEAVTISGIAGSVITLSDPIVLSYTNAIIMPLVSSKLPGGVSISRSAAEVNMLSASFEVYDETDIAATTYATYQGYDLMDDDRVVGSGSVNESVSWENSTFDNAAGVVKHIRKRSYFDQTFTMRWHVFTDAAVLALRKWFYARRGKQKVFWASTKAKDLEPASDFSGSTATVYDHVAANVLDRTGSFDIQIEDTSGTLYNRRVTAYVAGTPIGGRRTVDLTLDAATAITLGNVSRISYLRLVRFDSDRIEMQFEPSAGVQISVPLIEVPVP